MLLLICQGIDSIADGIQLTSQHQIVTPMFLNVAPRVDFLGGGGTGASGSAIAKRTW